MGGLRILAGKFIFLGLFFVLAYASLKTVAALGMQGFAPYVSIGIAGLIAYIPYHLLVITWPERHARQRSKAALEQCLKPLRNAQLPDGTVTDFDPKWPIRQMNGAWAIDPDRKLIRVIATLGKTEIDQLLPLSGIVRVEAAGIDGAVDRGRLRLDRRPKLVMYLSDGIRSSMMTIKFARHEHDAARGWHEAIRRAMKDKGPAVNDPTRATNLSKSVKVS